LPHLRSDRVDQSDVMAAVLFALTILLVVYLVGMRRTG
jgi:hypothetical protein